MGIPSPPAWNNYGWSVSGSGQGAISESWHVDHTRQQDYWTLIGTTLFKGVMTSSSYDDWSYDLTFTEEKPLGTSPYAWRYTDVEGEGWGLFCAEREYDGSANYQTSVKQGTATLEGLKTYVETLTETNSYAIDFGLTAQGKIGFELDGTATQSFDKKLTYEGDTGTVVFGGGNGTIRLDESGCAESRERRQVDFSYRDRSYQAEAETTKTTCGHHAHNYQEASTYSSEDYDETRSTIGFRWPTFTSPYAFDYVYPTRSGTLSGGLDDGCGCGCGCGGIYGYETWAPRGRWSDTSSTGTIGRMPTGSLIAPADLAAASDLAQELGAFRELPLAPYATRTESTANYRRPNAIHGNGSPSLPQNAIFADWAHWRDHGRLNAWRRGGALHGHAPARPDSAAHIPSTRTSCDPLGKLIAKTRKGEHAEEKRGEQRSARSEGARATTRA